MPTEDVRDRAPEFPTDVEWLNTEHPLRLEDLRGRVILLDFWTYCCINCMHVLPDLRRLEEKYPDALTVIGVHSAKFSNEKEAANIRQAILRYGLEHPVVNDRDFRVWQSYGVRSWPTLVVIDPEGYVVGGVSGEGHYELLDGVVAAQIEAHAKKGTLRRGPLGNRLERDRAPDSPLSFPGKVAADEASGRLFISDSNHHRILVATLEGEVTDVIGAGRPGFDDGSFESATFFRPQGIVPRGDFLYIADTENHAIREADLKHRTVRRIAGTGRQGNSRGGKHDALKLALNSPWDVAVDDERLYIAMAGSHQIWSLDLGTGKTGPLAGTGAESIEDGPGDHAAFSQPSGLSLDGRLLYVADSEVSAVRVVNTRTAEVSRLVGEGLFEFGDQDGAGPAARLQHCAGVHAHDGIVYVADTYNHKIKRIDPKTRECATFLGDGKPGRDDGDAPRFYEPYGLCIAKGRMYVADTDNHAIRVVDLATRRVSTLELKGLRPPGTTGPAPGSAPAPAGNAGGSPAWHADLPAVEVAPGAGQINIRVGFPAGFHPTPDAPFSWRIEIEGAALEPSARSGEPIGPAFPLIVPCTAKAGSCTLRVDATAFYCRGGESGECRIKSLSWQLPVTVREGAEKREIELEAVLRD